jgi:hypothetical protein
LTSNVHLKNSELFMTDKRQEQKNIRILNTDTPRVALVTGAARGLGMAIAIHLLNTGHRVALLDWDAPELNRTATTLAALGEVLPLVADVGQPSDVELAVNRIAQTWGRLDALLLRPDEVISVKSHHSLVSWLKNLNFTGPDQ